MCMEWTMLPWHKLEQRNFQEYKFFFSAKSFSYNCEMAQQTNQLKLLPSFEFHIPFLSHFFYSHGFLL